MYYQGSHWFGKSGKTWKKVLIIMKLKKVVIFIWKMSRLSFHAAGKTSHKMSKIAREICVQVRELFSSDFGVNPDWLCKSVWMMEFSLKKIGVFHKISSPLKWRICQFPTWNDLLIYSHWHTCMWVLKVSSMAPVHVLRYFGMGASLWDLFLLSLHNIFK